MNNFIIAGLILLLFVFWKISVQKNRYLSPSLTGCLFWGIACIISYFRMNDPNQDFSTHYTHEYIIPFAMVTVCGFGLAQMFVVSKRKFLLNIEQLFYLQKRYRFILYWCFLLGMIRFIYTLSVGGIATIVDYRQASLLISADSNPIIVNFIRISGHLSMLGAFYILICAYIDGYTTIKPKSFLANFVMYGMIVASQGGRTFTMVYLLSYFFAYMFGHIHSGKKYTNKQIRAILVSMLIPLLYFSVVGAFRNYSEDVIAENKISRTQSIFSTFYYITEGLHVTDRSIVYLGKNQRSYDSGIDTFTTFDGDNYTKFRDSLLGTPDWCNVDSIIVPLYCDFGWNGSLVVWMFLCFIGEILFYKTMCVKSVVSLFLLYSIVYLFLYSTIGNPIPGGFRIMIIWIVILSVFRRNFFLPYNES